MSDDDQPRGAWPQIRAALLLLHIVAVVLMALPAPVGSERDDTYEMPAVREQLQQLRDLLGRVGVETTEDELADLSKNSARAVLDVRKTALRPFKPYYDLAGTRQGYRMFSGVSLSGDRLQVEIDRGGEWELIYLARDPDHTWRWWTFNHELTRSLLYRYVEKRYRKRFKSLSRWVAAEAAADFEGVERVRVSFLRQRIPSPSESRDGVVHEVRVVRSRTIEVDP